MAKTVEYHNPDFEDGVEFDVAGLKILNGGSVELSEDEELSFYSKHQKTVSDYFADDKQVKVSGKTELSKETIDIHTGQSVSAVADSLDEKQLMNVETPVDSEGNEAEEGAATKIVEAKEDSD